MAASAQAAVSKYTPRGKTNRDISMRAQPRSALTLSSPHAAPPRRPKRPIRLRSRRHGMDGPLVPSLRYPAFAEKMPRLRFGWRKTLRPRRLGLKWWDCKEIIGCAEAQPVDSARVLQQICFLRRVTVGLGHLTGIKGIGRCAERQVRFALAYTFDACLPKLLSSM